MSLKKTKTHYVYAHIRNDNGQIFYIGKGTDGKGHQNFYRAKTKYRRSSFWKNIVKKAGGYTIQILAICEDDNYAIWLECALIAKLGRRNLGDGILVNLTDGGDGACGTVVSEATRKKLSFHAAKNRGSAWIKAIRKARKNGGNGGVVKKGDKLPDWWKKRIAETKFGMRNPMWGRTGKNHPVAKAVINVETGAEYPTISMAAQKNGYNMKTLHNMLSGHRKNTTNMRLKDAA